MSGGPSVAQLLEPRYRAAVGFALFSGGLCVLGSTAHPLLMALIAFAGFVFVAIVGLSIATWSIARVFYKARGPSGPFLLWVAVSSVMYLVGVCVVFRVEDRRIETLQVACRPFIAEADRVAAERRPLREWDVGAKLPEGVQCWPNNSTGYRLFVRDRHSFLFGGWIYEPDKRAWTRWWD